MRQPRLLAYRRDGEVQSAMAEGKTVTTLYDVAEHLRTEREEMAAHLESASKEADGDTGFIV